MRAAVRRSTSALTGTPGDAALFAAASGFRRPCRDFLGDDVHQAFLRVVVARELIAVRERVVDTSLRSCGPLAFARIVKS
jgi:hypothetical protein